MKNYDELTKDLLKRRDHYVTQQKQKKKKIVRISTSFGCFLLVTLLCFGVWQKSVFNQTPPQPMEVSQTDISQESKEEVVSKETQEEKEPVKTTSKNNSQTTVSKVDGNQNEEVGADIGVNPTPEFVSITALQNWMLSKNTNDQFAQHKQALLSTMATGNQIVYYRPTIGNGNDILQLDRVKASYGVLYYYYEFVDDTSDELKLQISCYMDDTQKEFYNEIKEDAKNNIGGYFLKKQNNIDIIYADNQHGATMFCWPQFGGYILAYLEGENHADKVQEVLPHLNLEKVTLQMDKATK